MSPCQTRPHWAEDLSENIFADPKFESGRTERCGVCERDGADLAQHLSTLLVAQTEGSVNLGYERLIAQGRSNVSGGLLAWR